MKRSDIAASEPYGCPEGGTGGRCSRADLAAQNRRFSHDHIHPWLDWCAQHYLEPLVDVRRPHVELYARELEARGLAAATVALKLVVLTGFYRDCVEEQLLEHSPAVQVRRPKVSPESTRLGLDRSERGAFFVQAGLSGGNDQALACLLALTALRVSEACGADLSDPALANGHTSQWLVRGYPAPAVNARTAAPGPDRPADRRTFPSVCRSHA